MEIRYKSNKLEKTLTDDRKLVKAYGELAKKIKQRMGEMKAADNLSVLEKLPQLRLHPYKGARKDLWSIDIKDNWRILFSIANDPIPTLEDGGVNIILIDSIKIESIEDPH